MCPLKMCFLFLVFFVFFGSLFFFQLGFWFEQIRSELKKTKKEFSKEKTKKEEIPLKNLLLLSSLISFPFPFPSFLLSFCFLPTMTTQQSTWKNYMNLFSYWKNRKTKQKKTEQKTKKFETFFILFFLNNKKPLL